MILALLIACIPLVAWWRFGNLPLDRDYAPYAYPAVFGTPYLKDGHADIKPPLIHWSYKLWLSVTSFTWLSKLSLNYQLRGLNAVIGSAICFAVSLSIGPREGIMLALLLTSPTLWGFMAQTETMSVCLGVMALVLPSPWDWMALGLLPWANQKNALLVPLFLWGKSWPVFQEGLAILFPSVLFLGYLIASQRLKEAKLWLWDIPKEFGKTRTFKANTLSAARLLIPCLTLLAVPLATMQAQSSWALLALGVAGLMVMSKQIVPHHFLLLALPVALGSNMSGMAWLAFALVFAWRDGLCWWKPGVTYPMVFSGVGGVSYLDTLKDSVKIEETIRRDTKPEEKIWVDGMENHVYLNTGRMAWRVEIPELTGIPEGEPPRLVVFCVNSAKRKADGNPLFDYEGLGYTPKEVSNRGAYVLMERKC